MTFFETLLLGHLVGDYILQNNWMAQRKGSSLFPCLVHCLLYTAAVCLFTNHSPEWAAVVFLSHFPVDRWSLADKWLRLIGGRSLTTYVEHGHETSPDAFNKNPNLHTNYIALRGGFSALVYAVVDNTFHLLLLLGGARLLGMLP